MGKLAVGDKVPEGKFQAFTDANADQPVELSTADIFDGRVVVFGLPGAFTSVCSSKQLPQFVERAQALKEKGVSRIVCISVNDAWVMKSWGEKHGTGDTVMLLGDFDGSWTKAAGLEQDLPGLVSGGLLRFYSQATRFFRRAPAHCDTAFSWTREL